MEVRTAVAKFFNFYPAESDSLKFSFLYAKLALDFEQEEC